MGDDERLNVLPISSPPPEEVKAFILIFEKAVKTVKIYLPNNPQYQFFLKNAVEKFSLFFQTYSELTLLVRPFQLLCGDDVVYENEERNESLAYVLYKDGLRKLVFKKGLTELETKTFIELFRRDFTREYIDEDMVTLMWQHDFKNIRYLATEEFLDEYLPDEVKMAEDREKALINRTKMPEVDVKKLKEMISADETDGDTENKITLQQPYLQSIHLVLSEEEKYQLNEIVRVDAVKSYFPLLMETIFNIIADEKDERSIQELFNFIRRMLELELSHGRFELPTALMKNISHIVQNREGISIKVVEEAQFFMEEFTGRQFISDKLTPAILNEEAKVEDISAFITAMPHESAVPLLDLFEKVESMKLRKAICLSLADLVHNDISAIVEGLDDPRWYVVRNTVFVLGMLQRPEATIYLKKALSHKDARVRREALRATFNLEHAEIDDYILAALEDDDESLRAFTLKSLRLPVSDRVSTALFEISSSPSFRHKPVKEKKQIYAALARVGRAVDLETLRRVLKKRRWWSKEVGREQKYIIDALAASGSKEGIELLRKMAEKGPSHIRSLCRNKLKMTGRKEK